MRKYSREGVNKFVRQPDSLCIYFYPCDFFHPSHPPENNVLSFTWFWLCHTWTDWTKNITGHHFVLCSVMLVTSVRNSFCRVGLYVLLCIWAGTLGWWLAPLPFTLEFEVRLTSLGSLKETQMFLPHPLVKLSVVGGFRDREVACSASDLQGLNFESCVWREVSSHSTHHPQEVLLAQFSPY